MPLTTPMPLQIKSYYLGYLFMWRRIFLLCNVYTGAAFQGHNMRNGAHPITAVSAPSLQIAFWDIPLRAYDIFTIFLNIQHSLFPCTPTREKIWHWALIQWLVSMWKLYQSQEICVCTRSRKGKNSNTNQNTWRWTRTFSSKECSAVFNWLVSQTAYSTHQW